MPDATGRLTITYRDEQEAERALQSIRPDDDGFVECAREGSSLIVSLRASNTKGLLRAADDVLACLSVAEDVMNAPGMERPNA